MNTIRLVMQSAQNALADMISRLKSTRQDQKTRVCKTMYCPELRERLRIVEQDKMYHDPNLNICKLSRAIGTNRTYLTRAFRLIYGESFCKHINRLRIGEADMLLHEQPQLSLYEIAERVGYNSATSLYRNYVRIHGHAPRAGRRGIR